MRSPVATTTWSATRTSGPWVSGAFGGAPAGHSTAKHGTVQQSFSSQLRQSYLNSARRLLPAASLPADAERREWEEKWGESYTSREVVKKFADKWGKEGPNVWHERWGEDYDGQGGCKKWTDKWAERLHPDGATEQWGDKWTEQFGMAEAGQAGGHGTKHGEAWASGPGYPRYQRWWNEEHQGNGRVRKYGNSTAGESWDVVESMDTYYNPIPHFNYALAVAHSPTLRDLPQLPKSGAGSDFGLGPGLDDL